MPAKEIDRAAAFYSYVIPDATQQETTFRHSHWSKKRTIVREILGRTGTRALALNAFDECGSQCQVQWSEQRQKHRLSANYCKCRHCEPCARARANLIARNLRARLEGPEAAKRKHAGQAIRFITLTLKHSADPLENQLRRLTACFKKLRNTKLWKRRVEGGASIVEVKWTGRDWHPHLHIIAEGTFIDKNDLVNAWHEVTGDSFIADIRKLDRAADACAYLVKYVTKGINHETWSNPDAAAEWVVASRGIRVVNTYGTWRGWKLTKPEPGVNDWRPVMSLQLLIERMQSGDAAAEKIFHELRPPGSSEAQAPRPQPPP